MSPNYALGMVLALTPAALSAQPPAPDQAISSTGQGQYEVLCKLTTTSGDDAIRNLVPGRETIGLKSVRRAECDYKASASGSLTLTVVGSEWACPFAGATEGACQITLGRAAFGNFSLRRKSR